MIKIISQQRLKVVFEKLNDKAKLPSYAHDNDSGMDLYSVEDQVIKSGQVGMISIGLKIELPENTEAQVRPKSGIALNHSVTVLNTPGTIDESFRGEIKVILINHGQNDYEVKAGNKIAQLVICPVIRVRILESNIISKSSRGHGGFGSTGIN